MNTNFFFSNFSGASGISRQNPGISRQKSLISLISRGIPNFLAPTPSRGRHPPDPNISGPKSLGSGSLFFPEFWEKKHRRRTFRKLRFEFRAFFGNFVQQKFGVKHSRIARIPLAKTLQDIFQPCSPCCSQRLQCIFISPAGNLVEWTSHTICAPWSGASICGSFKGQHD